MRIVIVGASLSGLRCVQALRRDGCDAHITVVDEQPRLACDRPPLSKGYLIGSVADAPPLLSDGQVADLDLDLCLGERATDVDPGDRSVGLRGGRRISYDTLVVASGSAPRTIGETRPRVHVLRTDEDAAAIRSALAAGARTVIVGGGFIGAEVAWAARRSGCDVTVIEPQPAMMLRGLGRELGAVMTARHAAAGIRVRVGVGVSSFDGSPAVSAVRLSDGTVVPADLVVVGVGATPRTSWLAGCGLDLADGVRCDERLAVDGLPGVYAAGDAARWYHPRYGEHVRMEHWTNAVEQAGVVAANICGRATVYDAVPYVWSDQLGARLQVFGRVREGDEIRYVVRGPAEDTFVAVAGGAAGLSAVIGFGAVRDLLPWRRLLVEGGSWQAALDLAGATA